MAEGVIAISFSSYCIGIRILVVLGSTSSRRLSDAVCARLTVYAESTSIDDDIEDTHRYNEECF